MLPTDAPDDARQRADARAAATAAASDPHRPRYHFLPPRHWMNDPNGLIQWKGQYHLFYQHNPHEPVWGKIHWGHAVSPDLVHWTDLPIALAPTPGSPDEDGCWSGCAFDADGVPTVIYTGARGPDKLPCLATGSDDLVTWTKFPGNPIIPAPPADLDLVGFRDHSVWRDDGVWYQLIGAGIRGVGGAALLYRSSNLLDWDYLHPILVGDRTRVAPHWTGAMWECTDLFPLAGKHVLVASIWDDARPTTLNYATYFVGTYRDHRFVPDTEGILDTGGHFYAPQTLRDDAGRRLMWGWLWEGRDEAASRAAGWAGVMSLPRVLSLLPDGHLGVEPVPELYILRGDHRTHPALTLEPGHAIPLHNVGGDGVEIVVHFAPGDALTFGLRVRRSPDGAEETVIAYDRGRAELVVDCARSSLAVGVDRDVPGAPLALAAGEPLHLRVFIDRSVLEVFANGRVCISERIYPSRTDSVGVAAFAQGGHATLTALDCWQMRSIWDAER